MAQYPSYKDSGFDWIGQIPSHWGLLKSKFLWRESFNTSATGTEDLLSVSQYDGVTPANGSRSESLVGYKVVEENNLVINIMLAWMGGLGVSAYNGLVSPAYCVYKLQGDNNPKYMHYLYKTPMYLAEFARHSTGVIPSRWRMYTDDFGQVLTLIPPRKEQDAMVEYLDAATAKIDEAIAQQQRMIDLLNERKQMEIVRATTKGIRTNRVMKDSGNNWIGFIPEDWNIVSLKRRSSIILGKMLTRGDAEKGDFYICAKDVHFDGVEITDLKKMFFSHEEKLRYRVKEGDLLIVEGGAGAGGCAVVKELLFDVFIQNSIMIIRGNDELDNNYVAYFLQGIVNNSYIDYVCNKATIPHFTKEKVGATIIPLPSVSEQKEIIRYLDERLDIIDKYVEYCESLIFLLQERKQIIINDVVTGKVKVV